MSLSAEEFYQTWRLKNADDLRGDWPIRMLQAYMDKDRERIIATLTDNKVGGIALYSEQAEAKADEIMGAPTGEEK